MDGVAGTTYVESLDGVKWTKPILRQWKFQGSLENNFVAVESDSAWPANAMENVVYDPDDADPQRRFKGFLGAFGRNPIVSPDGIHWKKLDVPMLPSSDDQLQQLRYNDPADYNADVYNVGVFRYEGLYVALPAVYHATGKIPIGNTDGFHLIQLSSSRDLQTWQRAGDRRTRC